MEHKLPLCRGGLHDPSNLAMACKSCNSSKRGLTEEFDLKRRSQVTACSLNRKSTHAKRQGSC